MQILKERKTIREGRGRRYDSSIFFFSFPFFLLPPNARNSTPSSLFQPFVVVLTKDERRKLNENFEIVILLRRIFEAAMEKMISYASWSEK